MSKVKVFERYEKFTTFREAISKLDCVLSDLRNSVEITDKLFNSIYVCASEALNNAIIHGNQLNPSKCVELYLYVEDNAIHLDIIDEGEGFDESKLADPLLPENLNKENGRGVFIINQFCCQKNTKKTQRGFCVSMVFNLENKDTIQ